jgi:hypothetical protein
MRAKRRLSNQFMSKRLSSSPQLTSLRMTLMKAKNRTTMPTGDQEEEEREERVCSGTSVRSSFLIVLVSKLMRGFGESGEPRDDTLELLESYVFEFINNLI